MKLFSDADREMVISRLRNTREALLITFHNAHGPTALSRLWSDFMADIGLSGKCISWWSGTGNIGLIECENEDGPSIYGQWVLSDQTRLVSVIELDREDLVAIRDGFETGNVTSSVMRTIRIGETFDRD
ncbi:MAG: hypothetical protein QXQ81_09175 [Candidatus Thorarchaeota archaeon]